MWSFMRTAYLEPGLNILFQKRMRWLYHAIFWLLVLFFYTMFFGHQSGNYLNTFLFVSALLIITIATSYFFIYFLIPRYFEKHRYGLFILFSIYTVLASLYLETLAAFLMLLLFIFWANKPPDQASIDVYFLVVALYFVVFLVIAIKLLRTWYSRQQALQEISRQKLETELKMLKSQIQPHFLFNSLNSIYALSLKKSDEAPEMIIKLSGILDYLLYECDAEQVPLEKEIQVIEDYIELQKVRYGEKLDLNFEVLGEPVNTVIVPMLFLPLVENSFKHGADSQRMNPWIRIKLEVLENRVLFSISNSHRGKKAKSSAHSGIGLANLEKRLQLLYPGRYRFELEMTEDKFEINLQLELNES